jgi:hypothetical protein
MGINKRYKMIGSYLTFVKEVLSLMGVIPD